MKKLLWCFLTLLCTTLFAQPAPPPRHLTRERSYHVVHYKLILSIDTRKKTCQGDAVITLTPLRPQFDAVLFDAADLQVSRVTLDDKPLVSSISGDTLSISLSKPYTFTDTLTLDIKYSVVDPKKGLYFIQPDSGNPRGQWQAWTQGEAEDNHYWFPCYDYPNDLSTSETIVTVDDQLTAVSNGSLLEKTLDKKHHTATFHWLESKPHVSYLISLAVAQYVNVEDSAGSLPIENYVYPHEEDDAVRSFGNTSSMIEYFSKKINFPFPWEKYGHALVENFMFSGEENVSISTITDHTIHDARADLDYSSDPLVAHELAHQWWGDLVSFRDWSHAWLSEGFATFFEMAYEEHAHGHDVGAKVLHDAQQLVVNSDRFDSRRPTVCDRYNNPMELFDNRIYQKGACVLHMLRYVLGEELFWKSLDYYVHKFAFHNAETNDLKVAIEEATGYNLQWFFDEWLYHAGYPEFFVQTSWDKSTQSVFVTVKQQQKIDSLTPVFRTPVDIEVWVHDVPQTYRVEITQREERFSFPAYQQPQLVIFDKGGQLLKREVFQKSLDEWLYQLQHAEEGMDRLAALEELQWVVDSSRVRMAVEKGALEDYFPEVRRDATWALGDVKSTDETDNLIKAYGDRESGVRVASVTSLGKHRGEKVVSTLTHAFERDSSYVVAAAALRSLVLADSVHRREYLSKALLRDSYNEGIRSAALQCFAEIGDREAIDTIIAYTHPGHRRDLRIQAIRSLGSLWNGRDDILQYIFRYLKDPSYFVRRSTVDVMARIGNAEVLHRLKEFSTEETDPRLVKVVREAIQRVEDALNRKDSH